MDWASKRWFYTSQMLSKTLDEAESEDWICELGNEFCKQMELYSEYPEEKVCMVENKSVHNACILCLVYNVPCIDSLLTGMHQI